MALPRIRLHRDAFASLAATLILGAALYIAALEIVSTFHGGLRPRLALACALGSFAVGSWLVWCLALLLYGARWLPSRVSNSQRAAQLETFAVFALAFVAAWWLSDPLGRRLSDIYLGLCVATAGLCALAHWLGRAKPPALAAALALFLALAAMFADQWLNPNTYPELHDLLLLIGCSAATSALSRVALVSAVHRYRIVAITLLPLVVVPLWFGARLIHSDWRRSAILDGSGLATLARVLHKLVDFDRDGFSPLLGGGDCDDFDASRNPKAIDMPGGGDANCNGVDRNGELSDSMRGLAPASNSPALADDGIDLFVLITIDCWRADAFNSLLSPRLWDFASHGLIVERMYAAASETRNAMPLTQRARAQSPFAGEILAAHGVSNSGVSAGIVDLRRWGIDDLEYARDASETSDRALAQIEKYRGGRHFLWVHYYDLHETYRFAHSTAPAGNPSFPATYRAAAAHVDSEAGRFLAELRTRGLLDRSAVLITGDHGEGLGDHGVGSHARSGFESVLRVPGIFVAPGVAPRSLPILGSHRDLPATILGAFGLEEEALAAEYLGRSWLRVRAGPMQELHDFVVVHSARLSSGKRQDDPLAVLVDERFKLVAGVVDGFVSLYDLREDPGELDNQADQQPARVQAMWSKLAAIWDEESEPPTQEQAAH